MYSIYIISEVSLFRKLTCVNTIVNNIPLHALIIDEILNSINLFLCLLMVNKTINKIKIITIGGVIVVITASLMVEFTIILNVSAGSRTVQLRDARDAALLRPVRLLQLFGHLRVALGQEVLEDTCGQNVLHEFWFEMTKLTNGSYWYNYRIKD